MNWLGYRLTRDPWGKLLAKAGVKVKDVKEWAKDPQVTFGPIPMTRSLFDTLEDTDSDWCAALCSMINAGTERPKKKENVDEQIAKLKKQIEGYAGLEKCVTAIQQFVPPPKAKAPKVKP